MKRENEIQDELNKISGVLAGISRSMPGNVPPGYFENFASGISATIKEMETGEERHEWNKIMPYSVPSQYFSELTNNIVASAKLSDYQNDNAYSVPAGYFEQLPEQILVAAKAADPATKETRIIPLKPRISIIPRRWAAAAVILITIGLGGYMFFNSQSSTDKILASVPANDIQDYLKNTYRLDVDRVVGGTEINNLHLENKDIIEYLNESGWD